MAAGPGPWPPALGRISKLLKFTRNFPISARQLAGPGPWLARPGERVCARLRQVLHAVGDVTLDKPLQFGILQLVLRAEVRREVPRVVTRKDVNGALAPVRDLDGHLEDNPSSWPASGEGLRERAQGRWVVGEWGGALFAVALSLRHGNQT